MERVSISGCACGHHRAAAARRDERAVDVLLNLRHGPNVMACDARLRKGQEMGWFEHGSTAIVFAPERYSLRVAEGATIRMGEPPMRLP